MSNLIPSSNLSRIDLESSHGVTHTATPRDILIVSNVINVITMPPCSLTLMLSFHVSASLVVGLSFLAHMTKMLELTKHSWIDLFKSFGIGLGARAVTMPLTYPFQVICRQMQVAALQPGALPTARATARNLLQTDGIRGFYRGFPIEIGSPRTPHHC